MNGLGGRLVFSMGAIWLLLPSLAAAGGHHAVTTCEVYPKTLGCFLWKLEECEQTVYTVEYKEETKKVKRPVIKEVKRPVTCKVCKPFDRTVLRECLVPKYNQDFQTIKSTVERQIFDECGKCCGTEHEQRTEVASCLLKTMVPIQVPVLEWESIPVEDTYDEIYLVQDWEEQEVTLRTPVKTAKTIKTKVWKKVPYCPPGCDTCAASCADGHCGH